MSRVRITIKDGVVTNGRDQIRAVMNTLKDGEYIWSPPVSLSDPHTIEEWRKLYFHLRDVLHDSVETGYTKKELHDEIKVTVLSKMWEIGNMEWFTEGDLPALSTQYLSAIGWREFMVRFRELSLDMFDVYV